MGEEVRDFWNKVINKGSEVEDPRGPQFGVGQYSSTSQLVIYHLVNDAGRLICCIRRAKPDVRIECLLPLCSLAEHGTH